MNNLLVSFTTDVLASLNEVLKYEEREVVRSMKARLFNASAPRQVSFDPVTLSLSCYQRSVRSSTVRYH